MIKALAQILGLLLVLALVPAWGLMLQQTAADQNPAVMLDRIEVAAAATRFELGRANFIQDAKLPGSAADRHVVFDKQDGAWSITNISTRALWLDYRDDSGEKIGFDASHLPIEAGDSLIFPSTGALEPKVHVVSLDRAARSLTLRVDRGIGEAGAKNYTISLRPGAIDVLADQKTPAACPNLQRNSFALVAEAVHLRAFFAPDRETLAVRFGGVSDCTSHSAMNIAIPGSLNGAALLYFVPNLGFAIARSDDAAARLRRGSGAGSQDFWLGGIRHPIAANIAGKDLHLVDFIAGYTKFGLDLAPARRDFAFTITPIVKSQRIANDLRCRREADAIAPGESGRPEIPSLCRPAPRAWDLWRAAIGLDHAPLVTSVRAEAHWFGTLIVTVSGRTLAKMLGLLQAHPRVVLAALPVLVLLAMVGLWLWRNVTGGLRLIDAGGPFRRFVRRGIFVFGTALLLFFVVWKAGSAGDPMGGAVEQAVPLAPWPALVAWSLAILAVGTARGAGLIDLALMGVWTMLLIAGHTALMALTLQATELGDLRFADDTTMGIVAAAGIVIAASQIAPAWLARVARSLTIVEARTWSGLPPGLSICGTLVLAALGLWFLLGTEQGIKGVIQPSEIVKTLTVLMLAAALSMVLDRDRGADRGLAGTLATLQMQRAAGQARSILATAALAATLFCLGLRWLIGANAALEAGVLAAGLTASLAGVWQLRNTYWRSFLLLLIVLMLILFVPIVRNDQSPFIIMAATSLLSFAIVLPLHAAAVAGDRLREAQVFRAPPPDWSRLTRSPEPFGARLRRRTVRLLRLPSWFWRPEPWIFGATLLLGALLIWGSQAALTYARFSREQLISVMGTGLGFDKPAERFISWLELNGTADAEGPIVVEFPDVALQVKRSRLAIASSPCGPEPPQGATGPLAEAEGMALRLAGSLTQPFFGSACPQQDANLRKTAIGIARRMPEIQNDFIGTWLMSWYGRGGALVIVLLQSLLVCVMLAGSFLTIKWTPGHLYARPAAAAAAYATIGFAVMLSLQWSISWMNALGLLPVMGQPATFLSHGPSHLLLFGVPALVAALSTLRMRSAFRFADAPRLLPDLPWIYWTLRRR